MAHVKPFFEVDDSRTNREIEEGSSTVKFTTVNGHRGALSPSQNTSFRPDPTVFADPFQHHIASRQAPPPERKHKPLFVDSEESRGAHQDDPFADAPELQSNRTGKRKRSADALSKAPSALVSPPSRREEGPKSLREPGSPARSLPPLIQTRESEQLHVPREQLPGWRQPRPSPAYTDAQLEDVMRRDSHMHKTRDDYKDGSGSPQPEADMQSDQESEMQNESLNGRKGPAQRRRFSQRTKTGCHTCRRRKKKCDEGKPQCQNCTRGGFACEGYGPKNELNVKLVNKTVPLQAKTVEVPAPPAHRQSVPGPAAESWIETQRRLSHDSRTQPFVEGPRYPAPIGPRRLGPPEDEPPFPSNRFHQHAHESSRAVPPSSRFVMSAPSVGTNSTTTGSLSQSRSGGSVSLGSAFDTPRPVMTGRLAMNPHLSAYPSSGPTEKENMLNGRDYRHFTDPELLNDRAWCKQALERYNKACKPSFDIDLDGRMRLFRQIIQPDRLVQLGDSRNHPVGHIGSKVLVEAPFKCEYGYNIHLADNVVIQSGCVFYDPCPITIGRGTIVGPNVKFYGLGPDLKLDARARNGSEGKLRGGTILIEEDCYIGGDVVILPNVAIGRECVIEPGTVISASVQPGKVVAGNPMRIICDVTPNSNEAYTSEYARLTEPAQMDTSWAERSYSRDGRMGM